MDIRLMTSNIWGDYFGNEVDVRDRQLEGIYRKYLPDVLGLQEMTKSWWDSPVWQSLSDQYHFVQADTQGRLNFTPLLYRSSRLEVIACGYQLYHIELDPSKGFTWAVFKIKDNSALFAVFNTHFMWPNGVEYDVIRRYNAMELTQAMQHITCLYDCPAFFMGDLNCTVDSLAWQLLNKAGYVTSFSVADTCSPISSHHGDPVRGEDNRYHGKMTENPKEKSIDHIGLSASGHVLRQVVVTDTDALDATDHSPVYIDAAL